MLVICVRSQKCSKSGWAVKRFGGPCLALGHGIPYKGVHDESDMCLDHAGRVGPSLAAARCPASNCQVETPTSGPGVALTRHLSADCTEQEREARAVDAAQLLQAFKEGKGIDLSGVIVRGDLIFGYVACGSVAA